MPNPPETGDSIFDLAGDVITETAGSLDDIASGVAADAGEAVTSEPDQSWKEDLGQGVADIPNPAQTEQAPEEEMTYSR